MMTEGESWGGYTIDSSRRTSPIAILTTFTIGQHIPKENISKSKIKVGSSGGEKLLMTSQIVHRDKNTGTKI